MAVLRSKYCYLMALLSFAKYTTFSFRTFLQPALEAAANLLGFLAEQQVFPVVHGAVDHGGNVLG
jgi:hypothetical protein